MVRIKSSRVVEPEGKDSLGDDTQTELVEEMYDSEPDTGPDTEPDTEPEGNNTYIYVQKATVTAQLDCMVPSTINTVKNPILLPWYTYPKPFSSKDIYKLPNYTEYQLFCFLTKYSRALKWFNKDFSLNYYKGQSLFPKGNNLYPTPDNIIIPIDEANNIEGGTQVKIDIYDDSQNGDFEIVEPLSLSDDEHHYFQKLADDIFNEDELMKEYCILLNVNELEYDSNWAYNMLKYIKLDYPNFIKDGNLYVKITDIDFRPVYTTLTEQVKQDLDAFNASSAIYLDHETDSEFIKNWELDQLIGNIYKPNWIDNRFAPNRYEFLRSQLFGEPIYLSYEVNNESLKHIVNVLKGYTWFITRNRIGIYVKDYFDAISATDNVFGNKKTASLRGKNEVTAFILGWPNSITI